MDSALRFPFAHCLGMSSTRNERSKQGAQLSGFCGAQWNTHLAFCSQQRVTSFLYVSAELVLFRPSAGCVSRIRDRARGWPRGNGALLGLSGRIHLSMPWSLTGFDSNSNVRHQTASIAKTSNKSYLEVKHWQTPALNVHPESVAPRPIPSPPPTHPPPHTRFNGKYQRWKG